jgi:hypothetical protein
LLACDGFSLDEGLLDHPGGLARRDCLAAFERARAGATGDQERDSEPGAKERRQITHCGRRLEAGTLNLELRTLVGLPRRRSGLDFGLWALDFRLQPLDFG